LLQCLLTGNGAAYVVSHVFPEGTSANSTGHQVGCVEAEGGGIADGLSHAAGHRIHVPIQSGIVVGQDSATLLNPGLEGLTG